MTDPHDILPPAAPEPPTTAPAPTPPAGWQSLPARGARLAGIGGGIVMGLSTMLGSSGLLALLRPAQWWWWLLGAGALGAVLGAWFAVRRHQRTAWRLDEDGFALRRGHWWHTETRVPISRVQHLDLKRGPLERAANLATLVVHTAGTKLAAVAVSGLDSGDAERLRDRLARQLDVDDDAL